MLRISLAAVLLIAQSGAVSAADQGRLVLSCKGTVTIFEKTPPAESGVILDFGKRVVMHGGAAYKMTNVTDTTIVLGGREDLFRVARRIAIHNLCEKTRTRRRSASTPNARPGES